MREYVKKVIPVLLALVLSFYSLSAVFAEDVHKTDESTLETEQTTEKETATEKETEKETELETEAFVFDESKMGDVNEDGKVTSADARILLRCAVKLEKLSDNIKIYGDFDKNGKISADDARTALRIAVELDCVQCILHGHKTKPFKVAPTCTTKGYTVQICQRCSYLSETKTNITKPLKHKLVEKTTKATCTEDGIYTSICSVCSFVAKEKVSEKALGHSFGVWELSGKTKTKTCKTCGYKETAKNVKTVYLTFDDGPGPYTEKLLKYLKKYDVKATFFVTNQSPKYKYMLKEIVEDGHAIGVHTRSHEWSIYSSRKSYLKDFDAMHKIILDETGVDTKIMRFPGGTNNTVSRKYSRGIMKDLASYMTKEGYIYFDWNVDCGDTSGYSSSKIAQTTINQIKKRHTSVVLMHDIKRNTVEAVSTIIEYCLKNGYEFAVIDESTPRVQFKPAN